MEMKPLWPKTTHPFLKKIDHLIRFNVSNHLFDANDLSRQLGISASTLNRFLKKEVDTSSGKLIRNFRLAIAYRLITETNMPLKSISLRIGFIEPSNFTRSFLQRYHKRPSDLRMKTTQKKNQHRLVNCLIGGRAQLFFRISLRKHSNFQRSPIFLRTN